METTKSKTQKSLLKRFFFQYFKEINEWNDDTRRGFFLVLPLVIAGLYFIVHLLYSFTTLTVITFYAMAVVGLFKALGVGLFCTLLVTLGVGIYVAAALTAIRFLEWVKSDG